MAFLRDVRFPEVRATRAGALITKVEWDPCDGEPILDFTPLHVLKVEKELTADGSVPSVKVTFRARLVEVDEVAS